MHSNPYKTKKLQNRWQMGSLGMPSVAIEPELIGPPVTAVPIPSLIEDRVEVNNDSILSVTMGDPYDYKDIQQFIKQEIGDVLIDTTNLVEAIIAIGAGLRLGMDLDSIYNSPAILQLQSIDFFIPQASNPDHFIAIESPSSIMSFNGQNLVVNSKNINLLYRFLLKDIPSQTIIKWANNIFGNQKVQNDALDRFVTRQLIPKYFKSDKYPTSVIVDKIKIKNADFIQKIKSMIKVSYCLCAYGVSGVRDMTTFLKLASFDSISSSVSYNDLVTKIEDEFYSIALDNVSKQKFITPTNITRDDLYLDFRVAYRISLAGRALVDILSLLSSVFVPLVSSFDKKISGLGETNIKSEDVFRDNRMIIDKLQYSVLKVLSTEKSLYIPIPQNTSLATIFEMIPFSFKDSHQNLGFTNNKESLDFIEPIFKKIVEAFNFSAWDSNGKPQSAGNLYGKTGLATTSKYACDISYLNNHFEQVNVDFMSYFQKNSTLFDILRKVVKSNSYQLEFLSYSGMYGIDTILSENNIFLDFHTVHAAYDWLFLFTVFIIQNYAKANCGNDISSENPIKYDVVRTELLEQTPLSRFVTLDNGVKLFGISMICLTMYQVLRGKRR